MPGSLNPQFLDDGVKQFLRTAFLQLASTYRDILRNYSDGQWDLT